MKTNNNNYSFKHEGQLLEKDLKAMIKKIKADTKELKKRVKAYTRRVDKFYDENYKPHPDLADQVAKYCAKVDDIIHFEVSTLFDDWQ